MKHTFKTLLGLVLVVFVLAGCSNPAGPEIPEVIETPVVETPEENAQWVEVEFVWGTGQDKSIYSYAPMYLSSLSYDEVSREFFYGFTGEDFKAYCDVYNSLVPESPEFKEFYNNALKEVFDTKKYKEGDIIELEQWTSEAKRLKKDGSFSIYSECLQFSLEDTEKHFDIKNVFDVFEVGTENVKIYVFFVSA